MSTKAEEEEVDTCCASCGRAEVDDVKLKKCSCDLVKYCSDECQVNQREQHEEECKQRMAEIRDRDLFEQPDEGHLGDCPICFLPLQLDPSKSTFMDCCSKTICMGCNFANQKRDYEAGLKQHRCAFCREPAPKSREEADKNIMKRIKKNDPDAMEFMGRNCIDEGDYDMAIEYWTKAAELGNASAHYNLSCLYRDGEGVQKDDGKRMHHMEEAAIGGHPYARYNLGCFEWKNRRFDRAKKHYIIAANLGLHESLQRVKELYADGHASKEDYANALRAYQTAVDATKSTQRKEGEAACKAREAAWSS
jgi:tetratricopeptide (TPR) repeat protein